MNLTLCWKASSQECSAKAILENVIIYSVNGIHILMKPSMDVLLAKDEYATLPHVANKFLEKLCSVMKNLA